MKKRVLTSIILTACPISLHAAPSGVEIIGKSLHAYYYAGADMRSQITLNLTTADGNNRIRIMTMLRKNTQHEQQRYFIYFHQPADVQGTSFLIWKYPERDDDRWMFLPAVKLVRQIAASDERSSFVGSDFTYEDVSGRDLPADEHVLLREEKLDGVDCYIVQSTPKASTLDLTKKLTWVDIQTFLPRKVEYYDAQNQVARVFTADKIDDVATGKGAQPKHYPTITRSTMLNVKSHHHTELIMDRLQYDVGIPEAIFENASLKSPPMSWIQY